MRKTRTGPRVILVSAALLGLAACGGSAASSSHPDGSAATPIDATIVQTMGTISLNDAGFPNDLPDPPQKTCNSPGSECPSPPSACVGGRFSVLYLEGQCDAGVCSWAKVPNDCALWGGTCLAGIRDDAIVDGGIGAPGGTWIGSEGCSMPVGSTPVPPATPCAARVAPDASEVCPPPQSVCAESKYIVYYDDGQCVAGSCVWQARYFYCSLGCSLGSCIGPGTPTH